MGGTETVGEALQPIAGVTYATEMIVKMASDRSILRSEYPCGCRRCQEMTRARRGPNHSRLAAIDVYDLPGEQASNYFH